MDKRQNNKKLNKNKHNNNKGQNKHNKSKPEDESSKGKLTLKQRAEIRNLVGSLVQEGVFENCVNPKDEWRQYENVQNILKVIQQVEAPLQRKRTNATTTDNRLANIDKFYEWAKENGLHNEGIEIKEFPDYDLGLAAARDIKKDDLIFSIPRQLIMSEENVDYEFLNKCFSFSNMRLAFTLMIEAMKPDSFWKTYIDLLPDKYNTVLYYTVEEMTELKGSNALSAALKLCQIVASLYVNYYSWPDIASPINGFKDMFNYDLLRWSISTVMTRENLIPRRSKPTEKEDFSAPQTISVLIPFWDMANHRNGFITSFFNGETQEMESRAQEDFKKGEQVFIHYGDRSNAELMIHNGFINPSNTKDHVAIKLGLSNSDALFDKRIELLHLLNIPKNSELKVLPPPEHIAPDLLAFVRVFNMNAEQLNHWIKSERAMDLLHIDCALETELEAKAWQFLQIRLMLLLKAFPTTLEDDETLLEGLKNGEIKPKRNYIKMMLLEYRIMEKRILSAALDYVKQRAKS